MNKALGLGLFAVAGYLLYEWWISQQVAANPTAAVASGAATPINVTTYTSTGQPTTTTLAVPTPNLKSQLLSAASGGYNAKVQGSGSSIMLTIDEWAYWYHSITGQFDESTTAGGADAQQVSSFLGVN